MYRAVLATLFIALAVSLTSCQRHPTLRYTPQEYAKLRHVEVFVAQPGRQYRVVATVTGSGGKFTARETMMNAMIDEAQKLGADGLVPLEFPAQTPANLIEPFLRVEDGKAVTKGNAIKWELDPRWKP